jgi:hypothetical protein
MRLFDSEGAANSELARSALRAEEGQLVLTVVVEIDQVPRPAAHVIAIFALTLRADEHRHPASQSRASQVVALVAV